MRIPNNKRFWIIGLVAVALIAAAFFIARHAIFAPVATPAPEDTLKLELVRVREEFRRQARELEDMRKEVRAGVREIRKTEYTRRQTLPSDDVAAELAALLERSRVEHADDR